MIFDIVSHACMQYAPLGIYKMDVSVIFPPKKQESKFVIVLDIRSLFVFSSSFKATKT